MERLFFMTLVPDDYHGAPMILDFMEDDFPIPPSEEEVFYAWSEAGYNTWAWRYEFDDYDEDDPDADNEHDFFDKYGDLGAYYYIYMVLTKNLNGSCESIKELLNDEINGGNYYDFEGEITRDDYIKSPDRVCEILMEFPGVVDVITINLKD